MSDSTLFYMLYALWTGPVPFYQSCSPHKASLMLQRGMFLGLCLALIMCKVEMWWSWCPWGHPWSMASLNEQLWAHFIVLRNPNVTKHQLTISVTNVKTQPFTDCPFFSNFSLSHSGSLEFPKEIVCRQPLFQAWLPGVADNDSFHLIL